MKDHELRAWHKQESPYYQHSEWVSMWELYQSVRWVPILRVIVFPINSRKPLSKQSGKATIIKVEVRHGETHNTWNRTLKAVWIACCWAKPSSQRILETAEPHASHKKPHWWGRCCSGELPWAGAELCPSGASRTCLQKCGIQLQWDPKAWNKGYSVAVYNKVFY